jgi:hypothetical protein
MKQIFRNIALIGFSICFLAGTVGIEIFHHICHKNNVLLISINEEKNCSSIEETDVNDCCKSEKDSETHQVEGCCESEIDSNVLSFNRADHCKNLHQIIKLDDNFLLPPNTIPLLIAPVQIDFSLIEFQINDLSLYFSSIKSQLPDFSSPRDWIIKFLQSAISNFSTGEEPVRIY